MPPDPSLHLGGSDTPPSGKTLFADLYQLTMAQAYWSSGHTADAVFSLFFRTLPPDRGYLVFAGHEDVLEHLSTFRIGPDQLSYLESLGLFDERFLSHLAGLRFTGAVRAMPEGSIFFAEEPVVEVTAPVIEAQIVETLLLNQVHYQTLLATKASRVVHAALGRTVVDFGARRTHGMDAADAFARVSYMAGFAGTSNLRAGERYGIPVFGTMAHSFVATFEREADAFRLYAEAFPDTSTFLVDTYDTLAGVESAIEVAREMETHGRALLAVRLDSGDLLELSLRARAMLDGAGLSQVQIFASGGLDEFRMSELVDAGAPIDGFGVGTRVGVSADAPAADAVYKLVEYDGNPMTKLSPGKKTLPGPKQVFRFTDSDGRYERDVIATAGHAEPGGAPLLREAMREGDRTCPARPLDELRHHFARDIEKLPAAHRALRSPDPYRVESSARLEDLHASVDRRLLS